MRTEMFLEWPHFDKGLSHQSLHFLYIRPSYLILSIADHAVTRFFNLDLIISIHIVYFYNY